MNYRATIFPSLKRRGGCAVQKISRSHFSPRRRGGQTGEIIRPERFRGTDHPVCGSSVASHLLIDAAATPPFQGGECRLIPIHSHLHNCAVIDRALQEES